MAHPVPTKGFLQLSPEAAMLSQANVEIRPLSPALLFLLVMSKEVTSQAESCMMHTCV